MHWNHHSDQVVGDVDPAEMWEDDDSGLEVNGRIDLDAEQGRKVWKSLKANRLGFSFGHVVNRSPKREDGRRDLLELDVFEVSATPSPMNNRTRVLSTKSIDERRYELPDGRVVGETNGQRRPRGGGTTGAKTEGGEVDPGRELQVLTRVGEGRKREAEDLATSLLETELLTACGCAVHDVDPHTCLAHLERPFAGLDDNPPIWKWGRLKELATLLVGVRVATFLERLVRWIVHVGLVEGRRVLGNASLLWEGLATTIAAVASAADPESSCRKDGHECRESSGPTSSHGRRRC